MGGKAACLPAGSTITAQAWHRMVPQCYTGTQGSERLFPTRVVSRLGSYSSALCGEMGAGSAALPISGLYESTNPFKTLW